MKLVLLGCLLAVVLQCGAYEMSKCELLQSLRSHGFPEDKLRDWMCLIQNESARKTHKVGSVNRNGSRDYGLFQINDKYWCSNTGTRGKDCNVTCAEVTSENVDAAMTCAKKIFRRHGFNAWFGWRNHCRTNLPQLPSC